MKVAGLMSGTSCDGVDAVVIDVEHPDRPHAPEVIEHTYVAFPEPFARRIRAPHTLSVADVASLHFELAAFYAEAVGRLSASVDLIGCHGQTLWHAPPSSGAPVPCSLQVGSGTALAQRTGVPVVHDFRGADIAAGGEGAPITPFAHWFVTRDGPGTHIVVNLGGILNFTWAPEAVEEVVAFDVGPAMMLVDAWARHTTQGRMRYDKDGSLSEGGAWSDEVATDVLSHPYFEQAPPKTTGRETFGDVFCHERFFGWQTIRQRDVAHTLVHLVPKTLASALKTADLDAGAARTLVLTGGGAHHPGIVRAFVDVFGDAIIRQPTTGFLAPQHQEPAAMALFAARTKAGLVSSLPSVTGATSPVLLGSIAQPTPKS